MELFAKRMTWELDNEEGLSCLSFELEDGYFTLSRKTGAETLRLEMNDPANGQLIDPDCFEYALDNTRFRLNIVRNNRKVLRYLEEHHINTELYGEIVLHYTPLSKPQLESLSAVCSATSFLRNWDSILEKKRANLRSISEPARLRQPSPEARERHTQGGGLKAYRRSDE